MILHGTTGNGEVLILSHYKPRLTARRDRWPVVTKEWTRTLNAGKTNLQPVVHPTVVPFCGPETESGGAKDVLDQVKAARGAVGGWGSGCSILMRIRRHREPPSPTGGC
jgi:hypothetical protein